MRRTEDFLGDFEKRCNRQVASQVPADRKSYRPWTNKEERYLKQHRTDGVELVAHALGRSISSVKAKACVLRVSLMYAPGDICPVCGKHALHQGTVAAKHGMCLVCWERRRADQMRDRAAEERERRRYDRYKHMVPGNRYPRKKDA